MLRFISPLFLVLFILAACNSGELETEMDEYCECLQKNIYNEWGRMDCLEMMDGLKVKYQNDPRKLEKMLELSEKCNF